MCSLLLQLHLTRANVREIYKVNPSQPGRNNEFNGVCLGSTELYPHISPSLGLSLKRHH